MIESTGMTTQARSSYLPSEILWGHRFQSLISFKKDSGEYEVDYAIFNNTVEVDTPLCSAKELDEHRAMFSNECLGKYFVRNIVFHQIISLKCCVSVVCFVNCTNSCFSYRKTKILDLYW